MRTSLLLLVAATVLLTINAAAQYHDPDYLVGAYEYPSSWYWRGIWRYDRTGPKPTLTKVCDLPANGSVAGSLQMDYDNRNLICVTTRSVSSLNPYVSTLCRYDATTGNWTPLIKLPLKPGGYPGPYAYEWVHARPFVDQNGDYIFATQYEERITTPKTTYIHKYHLLKLDRKSGMATTLLTTLQFPTPGIGILGSVISDIDSGRILIGSSQDERTPTTIRYPVLTLNPEDGYAAANVGYWNDGSVRGLLSYERRFEQDVRTGYIRYPVWNMIAVYELKPGSAPITTLTTIPSWTLPYSRTRAFAWGFDLQTAAKPRALVSGFEREHGTWLIEFDATTWTVTRYDTMVSTLQHRYTNNDGFEFYRGRHIQTVRAASNKWDIHLSVPHHPGKAYVLVGAVSGVRPGLALADGRNINLNWDGIFFMTLANLLKPYFDPGPLRLDANGEAQGVLDLSTLPIPNNGLGMPFWLAMAVIDSQASGGIAYLPDTYVMRL